MSQGDIHRIIGVVDLAKLGLLLFMPLRNVLEVLRLRENEMSRHSVYLFEKLIDIQIIGMQSFK